MRVLRAVLLTVVALPGIVRAQTNAIALGTRVRLHMVAPEYRVTIALTGTVTRTTPDSLVIAHADGIGETAVPRASILDLSVSLGRESAVRSLARHLPFFAVPIVLGFQLASHTPHTHSSSSAMLLPIAALAVPVAETFMLRRERWQPIDVAPLRR